MWKEAQVAWFEVLPRYLSGETEENHRLIRIAGPTADIWAMDLPNMKQDTWALYSLISGNQ
jgi:hypothetical protein